jgi:hypothetical protein
MAPPSAKEKNFTPLNASIVMSSFFRYLKKHIAALLHTYTQKLYHRPESLWHRLENLITRWLSDS